MFLQLLSKKNNFKKYFGEISEQMCDTYTYTLLVAFDKYFKENEECEVIKPREFFSWFVITYKGLDKEEIAIYKKLCGLITKEVPPEVEAVFHIRLSELKLATLLNQGLTKFKEGEEVDLHSILTQANTEYTNVLNKYEQGGSYVTSIDDLLKAEANEEGLTFPLRSLRHCMKPLYGGSLGILAARPNKGKTSLTAFIAVHWAKQLPEDKQVIWFNNEGDDDKILLRCMQAALGLEIEEIVKLHAEGILYDRYYEAIGGAHKIRVISANGLFNGQLERILDRQNPGAIIYDMLDNVRYGGIAESKTDSLECLYQWARDTAKKFHCPSIATSQVSYEGEGIHFPPQSALKDSKTGKPGACDYILMMGADEGIGNDKFRYISLPKNKMQKTGRPMSPATEVLFQATKSCFLDDDPTKDEDNDN